MNLNLNNLRLPDGVNPLLPLLITALATALVLAGGFVLFRAVAERRRQRWLRRLYGPAGGPDPSLIRPEVLAEAQGGLSANVDQKFDALMKDTGLGWTAAQGLGVMTLLSVALAGGLFLWREDLSLVAAGLVIGHAVPLISYLVLRRRQQAKLQEQLPDALFLLARSLRAGLSLEQSVATVAQHGTKPLGDEFQRSTDQIRLGLPVTAALQAMGERLKMMDFNVFVTAVTLHRTMGGNLTLLLDRVASAIRDRNLFRGYFRAATALSRLTAFVVAAAAPLLFVGYTLWQPELMTDFLRSVGGQRALSAALVLEVVGCFWLYLIMRVEY